MSQTWLDQLRHKGQDLNYPRSKLTGSTWPLKPDRDSKKELFFRTKENPRTQAPEARTSSRYKASAREDSFANLDHIRPLGSKLTSLRKIRQAFNRAKEGQGVNERSEISHYVNGPAGYRPSDLALIRALDHFKEQQNKEAEQQSNIVILAKRDISGSNLARRLLDLAETDRTDLAEHIEVLNTAKPRKTKGLKIDELNPRIIIINEESLTQSCAGLKKTDEVKAKLSGLADYIGLDQLKYLYLTSAHNSGSDTRNQVFNFFRDNMDHRIETGPVELIGTSHCIVEYGKGDDAIDMRKSFERPHYLGSPGELSGEGMPAEPKVEKIKTQIGDQHEAEGRKKYTITKDYAHNEHFIKQGAVKDGTTTNEISIIDRIVQCVREGDQRIIIRAHDKRSMKLISETLSGLDRPIATAITDHQDNKFINRQGKEVDVKDRTQLLDSFGKDYNVLIHCKSLDGEEIPADSVIVFALPSSDCDLEAMISPANTPYLEEEFDQDFTTYPRRVWFLEKGETEVKRGRSVYSMFQAIEKRHQDEAEAQAKIVRSGNGNGNSNGHSTKENPADPSIVPGIYYEYVQEFRGNPLWLKYLNEEVLVGDASLDEKIQAAADQAFEMIDGDSGYEQFPKTLVEDIIRGVICHENNCRDILEFAGIDIEDAMARFPRITGLDPVDKKDSADKGARLRVAYIANKYKLLKQAGTEWLQVLQRSYTNEEILDLAARFIYQSKAKIYLYDDASLKELLSVVLKVQDHFNEEEAVADEILDDFTNFLKYQTNAFPVLAAYDHNPERISLPADINSVARARSSLDYLLETRDISANPAWLETLQANTDTEKPQEFIADFLFSHPRYRTCYYRPDQLENAARVLLASKDELDENDKDLAREFFRHINNDDDKLSASIFDKFFPKTINLNQEIDSESKACTSIRHALEEARAEGNNPWLKTLDPVIRAYGNETNRTGTRTAVYAKFLFNRTDRQSIFASRESLAAAITTLQGVASDKSKPGAAEQLLFTDFVRFLETEYDHKFAPLSVRSLVGNLLQVCSESEEDTTLIIRDLQKTLNLQLNDSHWNAMLAGPPTEDQTRRPDTELALERVASYIHERHRDLTSKPADLALAVSFLCNGEIAKKHTKSARNYQANDASFNDFCDWLLTQRPELHALGLAEAAPYDSFKAEERVTDSSQALTAVEYSLAQDPGKKYNEHWLKVLDRFPENRNTILANFLLQNQNLKGESCFASLNNLTGALDVLLDTDKIQRKNRTQVDEADKNLLRNFYDYLITQYPDAVRRIDIVDNFDDRYFEISEVLDSQEAVREAAHLAIEDENTGVFPGEERAREFFGAFLLNSFANNRERIDYIADFLHETRERHDFFKDDTKFMRALSIFRGDLQKSNIQLNQQEQELLNEFITRLKKQNPKLTNFSFYLYFPGYVELTEAIAAEGESRRGLDTAKAVYILTRDIQSEPCPITKKIGTIGTWLDHLNIALRTDKDDEKDISADTRRSIALSEYILSSYAIPDDLEGIPAPQISQEEKNELLSSDVKLKEFIEVIYGYRKDMDGSTEKAKRYFNDFYNFMKLFYRPIIVSILNQFFPNFVELDRDELLSNIKDIAGEYFDLRRERVAEAKEGSHESRNPEFNASDTLIFPKKDDDDSDDESNRDFFNIVQDVVSSNLCLSPRAIANTLDFSMRKGDFYIPMIEDLMKRVYPDNRKARMADQDELVAPLKASPITARAFTTELEKLLYGDACFDGVHYTYSYRRNIVDEGNKKISQFSHYDIAYEIHSDKFVCYYHNHHKQMPCFKYTYPIDRNKWEGPEIEQVSGMPKYFAKSIGPDPVHAAAFKA
ncbi:MAG: hypothetical protein OXU45_06935 [Candidatus Melainabacteria bacterium]|nr:hypothetical protein [Candidatus Melainabacteria bacterium]